MAEFPLRNRNKGYCAPGDLARLPILAAAFLIALFGILAGSPRTNADISAAARPIDDRSERSPAVTKRDPMRAVTTADRKDGAGNHLSGDDGILVPALLMLAEHHYTAIQASNHLGAPTGSLTWAGAQPRAPPLAA